METLQLTRRSEPVLALRAGEVIEVLLHEGDAGVQGVELLNVGDQQLVGSVISLVDWLSVDGEGAFEIEPGGKQLLTLALDATELTADGSPYETELVLQSNCGVEPERRQLVRLIVEERKPTQLLLNNSETPSFDLGELRPGRPAPTSRPIAGWRKTEQSPDWEGQRVVVTRADGTTPIVTVETPPWIEARPQERTEDKRYFRIEARLPRDDERKTYTRGDDGRLWGEVIFRDRDGHVSPVTLRVAVAEEEFAHGKLYPSTIELGTLVPKIPCTVTAMVQNFGNKPLKATIPDEFGDPERLHLRRLTVPEVEVLPGHEVPVRLRARAVRQNRDPVEVHIEVDSGQTQVKAEAEASVFEHLHVATSWQRTLAWGLDCLLNIIAAGIITAGIYLAYGTWGLSLASAFAARTIGLSELAQAPGWLATLLALWLVISPIYSIYCLAAHGTTVGKSSLGLKVIDRESGFLVDGLVPAVKRYFLTMFGRIRPWSGRQFDGAFVAWHDELLDQVIARNDASDLSESER